MVEWDSPRVLPSCEMKLAPVRRFLVSVSYSIPLFCEGVLKSSFFSQYQCGIFNNQSYRTKNEILRALFPDSSQWSSCDFLSIKPLLQFQHCIHFRSVTVSCITCSCSSKIRIDYTKNERIRLYTIYKELRSSLSWLTLGPWTKLTIKGFKVSPLTIYLRPGGLGCPM